MESAESQVSMRKEQVKCGEPQGNSQELQINGQNPQVI